MRLRFCSCWFRVACRASWIFDAAVLLHALHADASLLVGFVYVAFGISELGFDRLVSCVQLVGARFKVTHVPDVSCGILCVHW